jgi:hypothetical protein
MNKIIAYTILILLISCKALNPDQQRISFKYYRGAKTCKLKMRVPDGFSLTKIGTGGEGQEYRIRYADSSLIYISDAKGLGSVNDGFIRKEPQAYSKQILSDSASISGTDEAGRFWKEIKCCGLILGYHKVNIEKKEIFEQAISSVKYN